ncbi:MAG: helix-turn-helix domain-containing protein [Chloroflexota bacterium]
MDQAEEIAAAQRLGALLRDLRKSANLTQRELGRRAVISWTFIQLLEKGVRQETGRPVTPSPQSLQKIANGFAVDPLDRTKRNAGRAAQLFRQMMEARGWSAGEDDEFPPVAPAPPSADEIREGLAAMAGRETAVEFAALAENWYAMSGASRQFIMNAIRYVKAKEGLP